MRILLCTNGKKHVEGAITFSLDLLRRVNPEVTLLYVEPASGKEEPGEESLNTGQRMIHTFHPQIQVRTRKRAGDVVSEIIAEARKGEYDLLVFGSKGISESLEGVTELIISDVADDVIKSSPVSVLVVKDPKPISKVLVCTDGSNPALEAVRFWGRLKKTKEPRAVILNVVTEVYSRFRDYLNPISEKQLEVLQKLPTKRTEYLYQAKKILTDYAIEAKVRLREGEVVEEILKEAGRDYDLIIMGFRGRKDPNRPILGRQAIKVIEHAKIPVLAWKG